MTYKIGKFDLLGNFYGFETLTDQILICQTSKADVERLMTFGVTIKDTCSFDLSTFALARGGPENQNMFFELYI